MRVNVNFLPNPHITYVLPTPQNKHHGVSIRLTDDTHIIFYFKKEDMASIWMAFNEAGDVALKADPDCLDVE